MIFEVRESPFDRLGHGRARRVDQFPQTGKDRLGEFRGLLNVGVDSGVLFSHAALLQGRILPIYPKVKQSVPLYRGFSEIWLESDGQAARITRISLSQGIR